MTEEELSKAALMERYPESTMSYDWLAWYKLRDVYRDFKAGRISKEQGEAQKRSVFQSRQRDADKYGMMQKAELRLGKFWIEIEEAGRNYLKDPTPEHADQFVKAVYGAGRLERKRPEQSEGDALMEKEKPVTADR